MTLPTSGALTLSNVLTELKIANSSRATPVSLGDADVLALAGKSAPPISLSDLYGKSSYVAMSGTLPDVAFYASANPSGARTEHATVTLSLSGGIPTYSESWSTVSGSGSVNAANALSTTVNLPNNFTSSGDVITQVVQCVVTDGKGNTLTKQCTVTMTIS